MKIIHLQPSVTHYLRCLTGPTPSAQMVRRRRSATAVGRAPACLASLRFSAWPVVPGRSRPLSVVSRHEGTYSIIIKPLYAWIQNGRNEKKNHLHPSENEHF